jgi:hypothetical protein
MKTSARALVLRRTGLREARFSAGVVEQKARMNAVHRVFIGFPVTPSVGVHSRREAQVIHLTSDVHPAPFCAMRSVN